ncbi:MAG TPA: AMP-binding protein, partial [Thermoanaerobaculia bacterium]
RELVALYPALAELAEDTAGRLSPLPPLPVQYADFVLWQRESLRGAELERQLAFWRGALAGTPAVLDLPSDRPRPARASGRGGAVAAELSAEQVDALKALGRRAGATPFMTLLAAFYALLHRLTGETDLVVGTPVANRRRPELEGLIGFFANTLVLRLVLRAGLPAGEPTFADLLAAVREAALSAYAHQDLPFEKLVEELAPERSLAHSPLFQVMFLLHGTPVEEREISGLTLAPFGSLAAAERAAKFDLTLELVESGPGLTTLLEFRRDLFDSTTAARLLGHFAVLAAALSEGSEGRLADLPLLAEGDRHQLLAEWNDTQAVAFPEAMLLHQLFEDQAAARPAAPALVCGEGTLTYGALDERAGRLARHLRSLGVGPEVPVAVCAGRSADLVVALLAVLKAGGAYLPLDPAYPPERLAFLMEDTAAPVLVAPSSLADLLPAGAVRVALDAPETWIAGASLSPVALPANLAYLIYTSGSTGRPKAVAIPHGAAVALVRWAAEVFSAAELDGMLASTSICFDLSVFELFVPLSLGGRVILAENALELPELAAAGEVRMINTVPSAMGELVRLGAIPPSVRTVGLAGGPLRRELVQRIYAMAPGVERVLNLYGPSETTTYSTWTVVDRHDQDNREEPAIGRPITGTRAHVLDVLDGALAPVPIGVPGELFLSG